MEQARFENMNLSSEIQQAIKEMGFEEPSPIQAKAIPVIMQGRDIIGQAQTGTGKTAAFGIPMLEMIDPGMKKVQAIILCPTRELAIQVAEELGRLGKYKRSIYVLPVYGGQPIDRQIRGLKKGVQIVIGTPGRVMDHLDRGTLRLDFIKCVILDEADEMLDMGFREDIEIILKRIPDKRQTLLFSATMPQPILDLTAKYQNEPHFIKVVHKELTVPSIEQTYYDVKEKTKLEVLTRLIDLHNPKLALIFCNTKRRVDELVEKLQARGYSVDGLHGDMKQSQRDRVMSRFRTAGIDLLVATDVAARGLDVDDVEIVFNYDLPPDEEYYVHRIGRTGRAGRTGQAVTFIVGREIYKLRDIQKYTKTKIQLRKVPTLSDVEESKTNLFLEDVKAVIEEGNLNKYVSIIERLLDDDYSTLDIAAALLKIGMRSDTEPEESKEEEFENTGAAQGMVRLFINVGRNQGIRARDIVGSIAGETGLSGKLIGSIDIFDKYTFVEVPREYAKDVLTIMKDNQIKGNRINIEPAYRRDSHS